MEREPVVRCGDDVRTHAEIGERAARIAAGLAGLGVGAGDRVALLLHNDIPFLEITVAAGLVGAAPVPLNWHLRAGELRYLIEDCAATVVFVHSPLVELVREVAAGRTLIEVPVSPSLAGELRLDPAPAGGHLQLDDWLAEHEPHTGPVPDAPLSVIYTSGTTGSPKGVLREPISADRQLGVAGLILGGLGMAPGQRTLVVAPMYHSAPNAQAVFALKMGLDITIMARFDAEQVLATIERHRISHAQFVPTHLVRMLGLPDDVRNRYDVSSLESVVHAAAPCPPQVKQQVSDWFGPIVREFYGGTETGVVVACDNAEWLAHPGTVGRPLQDADVRILDENREPVAGGSSGEIFLKPPSCWPDFTYIGDDAKRARMDVDGYLSIGDIGYLDGDGFLYLNDRAVDMVISGGVNIYPNEIENCLLTMDGVRDAAVFGVPDPDLGEILAAHVDVDPDTGPTEHAIRAHLGERLARYKTPKIIVFDDALPREASGKLFKRRLKDRYVDAAAAREKMG